MTLPTGSEDFTAREVLPGVNYVYGWDISESFSVGAGTQANLRNPRRQRRRLLRRVCPIDHHRLRLDRQAQQLPRMVHVRAGRRGHESQPAILRRRVHVSDQRQHSMGHPRGVGLNEAADDFFTGSGLSVRMY